MGVFKFEHEQNSRGWNYRQLRFNLKNRKKRQAVPKRSKKDNDIKQIVEMYFKGVSLEEAINSVKGNNKEAIDELTLIKDNWGNSKISKGDLN